MTEPSKNIRCKVIIEVLGKPKEHIEKALKNYIKSIKDDSELSILNESYAEPKEIEKQLWTAFVEIDMLITGFQKLIQFCLDYMPSSIDIIKPDDAMLSNRELTNIFNDLQAKLHSVDMIAKNLRAENDFLKRNMNVLLQNLVMISLSRGPLERDKLSAVVGISLEELSPILDGLEKDGKILKKEDTYSINN